MIQLPSGPHGYKLYNRLSLTIRPIHNMTQGYDNPVLVCLIQFISIDEHPSLASSYIILYHFVN